MPDEIRPALTPEEWAKPTGPEIERGDLIAFVWLEVGKDLVIGRRYEEGKRFETVTRIAHELIALANAALPDDDPRKITPADVRNVEDAIGTIMIGLRVESLSIQGLWDLAAKLAALLPPA